METPDRHRDHALKKPLADAILFGKLKGEGGTVKVTVKDGILHLDI